MAGTYMNTTQDNTEKREAQRELARLVTEAQGGSAEAFEALMRLKSNEILFYLMSMMPTRQDAEDAAQEAVILIWRRLKQLREPTAFNAWMYRLVKNVGLRGIKSINKSRTMEISLQNRTAEDGDDEASYSYELLDVDEDFMPEKKLLNEELSEQVYDIVMQLPPKRREVVLMHYYSDLSAQEIAYVTGQTPAGVRSVLNKARNSMQEKLAPMAGAYALAGIPETEFGEALKMQASSLIDTDLHSFIEQVSHVAVATVPPVALGLKSLAIKALSALVGTSGVVAGVVYLDVALNKPEPAPEPAAPVAAVQERKSPEPVPVATPLSDAYKKLDILFEGDCDCGHVNPRVARMDLNADTPGEVNYVVKTAEGDAVTSGAGNDASDAVAELSVQGKYGKYRLDFTVDTDTGYLVEVGRDFEIVRPGEIISKEV
jgi:RNA polymerase sigma-70 factor (ECF subfamily)